MNEIIFLNQIIAICDVECGLKQTSFLKKQWIKFVLAFWEHWIRASVIGWDRGIVDKSREIIRFANLIIFLWIKRAEEFRKEEITYSYSYEILSRVQILKLVEII